MDEVPDGLDLNSKRLTYTEGFGDFKWGSNLVLNLYYSGGYYCSITNTGTGYSNTNGIISTSGKGEDAITGSITITNAGDIVVGFIDTRNTQRYPDGSYCGMPCGFITVVQTGSFYAARVRTAAQDHRLLQVITLAFSILPEDLRHGGGNCDIRIGNYSSVQIDGGINTSVTNISGGWPPGSASIYAVSDIQLSGEIDMRVNLASNGTLTMVSSNGSIYIEQLDMSKISTVTFNAGSKTSYIRGALLNFNRSGNQTTGALDAPAGQTVRYRAGLPANKYLMEGGYSGIYTLKSSGILKPAPSGLVIYFR